MLDTVAHTVQYCDIYLTCTVIFRPILEEQALLREKLKSAPAWKKDSVSKKKLQPVVSEIYSQIYKKLRKDIIYKGWICARNILQVILRL